MTRAALALAAALAAALVAAAPAAGHALFVDPAASPGGDCLSASEACRTIAEALAAPDPDPGSPDTIVAAPGTYTENVLLDTDRSLFAAGTGGASVLRPADPTAPTVEVDGPASVIGFEIEGPEAAVLSGPGTFARNTFDSSTIPAGAAQVAIGGGAGNSVVERNAFLDGSGTQIGVEIATGGSPQIRQNGFAGFGEAIRVAAGTPALASNLAVDGATAIRATGGTVGATNLTAFGNQADIVLENADLSLRSSIVEQPIAADAGSSCLAIAHSAGPTLAGGACQTFQLPNTAPGFVDPANGDYHLSASSPLVDAGDPGLFGGLDIDAQSRVLDGDCDGVARRDVGADELLRTCPAPPIPPAPPPTGNPDPPNTRIVRKRVQGRSVSFRFSADVPEASFRCRLDRKPFRDCESPVRYRGLDPGRHRFQVQAVDVAGGADPEPAARRFRVRPR